MILLLLGVALWWITHLFPMVARPTRNSFAEKMGEGPYKGVYSLVTLGAVALMVIGYRASDFVFVYDPPGWGVHLNNLLMFVAVALTGAKNSKSRIKGLIRHPMLTGVTVWAAAHLLVNGDLSSVLLFGGVGVWSVVAMFASNARDGLWVRPTGGTIAGDIRLAIISVVVFAVIAAIHGYALGVWPFPG